MLLDARHIVAVDIVLADSIHTATETKSATYRYKCRWQVDHASKYTIEAALKENNVVCDNPAVSDVKLWLCEKQVFSYVFKNGKSAVLHALKIIEHCKQEEEVLEDGTSLQTLKSRRDELKKSVRNYWHCHWKMITI